MTLATTEFCSQVAIADDAPLHGTAGINQRWLLLEYNGPWEAKAIQNNYLPAAVQDWFNAQTVAIGARPQFIKRNPKQTDNNIHFYLIDTNPAAPVQRHWVVSDYDELLDLDLAALLEEGTVSDDEQVMLICTNGKRDNCCAKFGLPVYDAFMAQADGVSVWQTTHTGGHRYSATGVAFPSGIVYGYLSPNSVPDVLQSMADDAINLTHYRGRVFYDDAVSAADYYVRQQVGNNKVGGIELLSATSTGSGQAETHDNLWTINFSEGDRTHTVRLTQSKTEPVMASCNGKMKPAKKHELVSFETVKIDR